MSEERRLQELSQWYLTEQTDLDKRLIRFRYQTLKAFLVGPRGLELGSAEGEMTRFLLEDFASLTIVDGARELLELIPDHPRLQKVHALFERYEPPQRFHTIILDHILEHVQAPVDLLRRIGEWLEPDGRIMIGVPNGHSIHRLAAAKMGILADPCQLNERDHALGHRRVYTPQTLRRDLAQAGLPLLASGGIFLKPLANQQIQAHWTEEMIEAFLELGKDFPDHAAEIYAVCGGIHGHQEL